MIQEMELKNKDGTTSIVYKWQVQSTTNQIEEYDIIVETVTNFVGCNCIGFRTRGRCKHIRFYKKLIKSLMHETPRV